VLSGGGGDDWLSGDRGSDTITGGAGADIFHSFSGAGLDVVTDFNAAEGDRVQLDPGTSYHLAQQGADTIVDMGNGDEMVLRNVQLASLPQGWIFTA
jgi:serralysin